MIFKLTKQLWHLVPAMAGMSTALQRTALRGGGGGGVSPKVL